MNGAGNDFVIFDARTEEITFSADQMRQICDRKTGVGCDQLVILHAPSAGGDIAARFYNADGSESGSCGNASRCIGHIYMTETNAQSCMIETGGGLLHAAMAGDHLVRVDMGAPKKISDLDLSHGELNNPVFVDMGNPHCVFFVENAEDINVQELGPFFENHELFPSRTNVEFAEIQGSHNIRLRVWERGAGETLACGSGACATLAAAVHHGLAARKIDIIANGGILNMELADNDHIFMAGPVEYEFEGKFNG